MTQWSRPEIDHLQARVDSYGTGRFAWWLHDHALPEGVNTIIAFNTDVASLQEAQDACDTALAEALNERAQHAAMVAEGAPELPGQAVTCG